MDGILPGGQGIVSSNDPFVRPDPNAPVPQAAMAGGDGHTFMVVKTATCSWCQKSMDFLSALHEARGDFNVAVLDATEQPEAFRQVSAYTKRTTVPQIFLDGKFVGGFRELADAAHRGQIDAYLDGGNWEALKPEPKPKRGLLARIKGKEKEEK